MILTSTYSKNALNRHGEYIVSGTTYIFAGNMNANTLRPDNKTERYLDTIYEIGFMFGINKPTRVATVRLDHFFVMHDVPDQVITVVTRCASLITTAHF